MVDYTKATKPDIVYAKYIHDVAQLSHMPEYEVEKVYDMTLLYTLNQLASTPNTETEVVIAFPKFTTIRVSRSTHKNSKYGIQMHFVKAAAPKYKQYVQDAFCSKKDYLLLWMKQTYTQKVLGTLEEIQNGR